MDEEVSQPGVEVTYLGQVVWIVKVTATEVALHHGHAVGGQGPCLVRTDGCRVAHRLTGVQMTNQIVVLQSTQPVC